MRIIHIARQFFPAHGGIEEVVLNLARRQAARGHDVTVVTLDKIFDGDGNLQPFEVVAGVKIIRIKFVGSNRYPLAPSVLFHLHGADILHVHAIDFFFDFLSLTKVFHGKKLVVSTHGGFFHTSFASKLKKIYFALVTRLSLASYAFVAASSENDREIFAGIRHYGMETVQNGVDFEKYSDVEIRRDAKQCIYFGRLAASKNIKALFPFLRSLRRLDPNWNLVIAGRPQDVTVDELMKEARLADCEGNVQIVVSPATSDLRRMIGASSIFVSPSDFEGFGIAAIEATGAGLFPVLSDIAAHRLTVAATGIGLLTDFSNPDAAAGATLNAWFEWQTKDERRKDFTKRLECYSWDAVVNRFDKIYEKVIGVKQRSILGASVRVTSQNEAISFIDQAVLEKRSLRVGFVNANLANQMAQDESFAQALQGFYLLNDGLGVDLASRLLYGQKFPENMNGTDFTPAYLSQTRCRLRLYLLGSTAAVIEACTKIFAQQWPQHEVVGYHHGFFTSAEEMGIADEIMARRPDIVLAAMGNPRQERWLAKHIPSVCPVGFAVGALFDFQAGNVKRAPAFVRKARLEWVFRLAQEPRRLGRRYLIGNALFLARVAAQYARGERDQIS